MEEMIGHLYTLPPFRQHTVRLPDGFSVWLIVDQVQEWQLHVLAPKDAAFHRYDVWFLTSDDKIPEDAKQVGSVKERTSNTELQIYAKKKTS